jgi:hypothetical protein
VTDLAAWADLHDARARLVDALLAEGLSPEEVAHKLNLTPEEIEHIGAGTELGGVDPPIPGSSRDRLLLWKKRTEDLERALLELADTRLLEAQDEHERRTPATDIRSLRRDPEASKCGCQHWSPLSQAPWMKGRHHPECVMGMPDGVLP